MNLLQFNDVGPEIKRLKSRMVNKKTTGVLVYEQLNVDFEIENTLERKNWVERRISSNENS
ncbi:uncharacterized protein Bfra_003038 [Botrytis fragariae]|uniref:Uncharacterized protein n=1 Tax=Botrytis fragariae TaxID=1964551 RepID=A0A8H6ELH5_9HELO|nr:uncharacterized protein Bfra_003038 [Botrytis fragariae]KAF5876632.1 hypothetical protein Bfra_003038 [Botrytis fragariae]